MMDIYSGQTALIVEHLVRRPGMEARDVYKLLYQGVRGPEHIIASPEAFRERLQAEWEALKPEVDDPPNNDSLWESIRPDGALVRLNLRPFKASGGNLDELETACLETGRRSWGSQAELQLAWAHFISACQEPSWPSLAMDDILAFDAWLQAMDFPPVHHSEAYRTLYRPAYRLVAANIRFSSNPSPTYICA
jgi:hypothetical protein